jgi:hypothetical protein
LLERGEGDRMARVRKYNHIHAHTFQVLSNPTLTWLSEPFILEAKYNEDTVKFFF